MAQRAVEMHQTEDGEERERRGEGESARTVRVVRGDTNERRDSHWILE